MFKRLCALNDAEAKECKVCLNRIEAAGRYELVTKMVPAAMNGSGCIDWDPKTVEVYSFRDFLRCLWLDYARLPPAIKSHIDASDRWRPEATTRAIPPILHVVRTRWTGPTLRPGPLWPSKGGPSL